MTGSSTAQISPETFRQQFPALQNKAYFNYGGQGPLPQVALTAIQQALGKSSKWGRFPAR
jgi:L-cysteine/cystine lyase